ncbi:MAG: hypothetical protein R2806_25060 [Saprospiraceae bacterium]
MRHVLILMLLAMVLAVTSCTKEYEVGKTTESQIGKKDLQAQFEAWKKNREGKEFEYKPMNLKAINDKLIGDGFQPFTAEEFGVSQEEFAIMINGGLPFNNTELESRTIVCYPDVWYEFLCDMNGNGYSDDNDAYLAQNVILGNIPPSTESETFGLLSVYLDGYGESLTGGDIVDFYRYRLDYYCN